MTADSPDLIYFKKLLLDRREEITKTLASQVESAKPVTLDQSSVGRISRGDALQQQALALAMKQRTQQELQRIESALRRIESGNFGVCITCEEPIALKRLELDPSVLTCVTCAL